MNQNDLKDFLDVKVKEYNNKKFIESDPIQIPHQLLKYGASKNDIEIISFLVATISWGNRKSIITNSSRLLTRMNHSPYEFVMNYSKKDFHSIAGFVHRTFNDKDLNYFIFALQNIYKNHDGLESIFKNNIKDHSLQFAIHEFKKLFFSLPHPVRTEKHVSDPLNNSAAKRINMFLRWMVRNDFSGVDFGIWNTIPMSVLSCPLDVHTGNVARKLGLISRKQNDAKALKELDQSLRILDAEDPVKYDFALFGLGVFESF